MADVFFPVGLSRQTDLFQDAEQFGSKRGCALHANTTILVPNETVGDIGLERVFEQQAIGRDLVLVAVLRATGSRTVPGLDFDWYNSLQYADQIVGFARQTVSLRGNRTRLRKLGAPTSAERIFRPGSPVDEYRQRPRSQSSAATIAPRKITSGILSYWN